MKLDIQKIDPGMRELVARNFELFNAIGAYFAESGVKRQMVLDINEGAMWCMEAKISKSKYLAFGFDDVLRSIHDMSCGLLSGPCGNPLIWTRQKLSTFADLSAEDVRQILANLYPRWCRTVSPTSDPFEPKPVGQN